MSANIRQDYLNAGPSGADLRPFYAFTEIEAAFAARAAHPPASREVLTAVLRGQYAGRAAPAGLDLLERPNTFCVTTGQQPGLFGGPLYVVYKALTAIRLCAELRARHPDAHFVPVFWIASEDHDFAEVNHTFLSFRQKAVYPGDFGGGAVGRHVITDAMSDVPCPSQAMRAIYAPGRRWADAFRDVLQVLFPELVVLDPDDGALKRLFAPYMVREAAEMQQHQRIGMQSLALAESGYPVQLLPRRLNLFHLSEAGRNRIEAVNDHYTILNRPESYTLDELTAYILEQPEDFSPNAALRPMYQEIVLPNVAYVGGWGEIAYWLQLKTAFEDWDVFYPMIVPRLSALLMTAAQADTMRQIGFAPADVLKNERALRRDVLARLWDDGPLRALAAAQERQFHELAAYAGGQDLSLLANVAGERRKMQHFYDHLRGHIEKRTLRGPGSPWRELLRLKNEVAPDGVVQERLLNFMAFAGEDWGGWAKDLDGRLASGDFSQQFVTLPV